MNLEKEKDPRYSCGMELLTTLGSKSEWSWSTAKINHSLSNLSLSLSLSTKRPRMLGFKTSQRGVEKIKKIRECELRRLEAIVGVPLTWGPRATSTSQPFDLPLLFERLGWK